MLLSGVALAGANRALAKNEDDGILFALEAQGLNLDGSELVVLSACDTARGSLDYAGRRLWPGARVPDRRRPQRPGDAVAAERRRGPRFMVAFYRTWLAQAGRSDPAKALRQTRLAYLNSSDPTLRNPKVWAPYVLIE